MRHLRFLDVLDLVDRQIGVGQVERAVEQRQHAGRGFLGRPDLDPADRVRVVRPAHEMRLVALHVDLFERHVGFRDQPVGAGAGIVRGEPRRAPIAVFVVRTDQLLVDDHHHRYSGEKRPVGLFEPDPDGLRIGRGDAVRLQYRQERRRRRLADLQHAAES